MSEAQGKFDFSVHHHFKPVGAKSFYDLLKFYDALEKEGVKTLFSSM